LSDFKFQVQQQRKLQATSVTPSHSTELLLRSRYALDGQVDELHNYYFAISPLPQIADQYESENDLPVLEIPRSTQRATSIPLVNFVGDIVESEVGAARQSIQQRTYTNRLLKYGANAKAQGSVGHQQHGDHSGCY
jgi:hypothetical protein